MKTCKNPRVVACMAAGLLLAGCGRADKPVTTDPTERGLTAIAVAIVVAAVIRGVMNK